MSTSQIETTIFTAPTRADTLDAAFARLFRATSPSLRRALLSVEEFARANDALHNFASARAGLDAPDESKPIRLAVELAAQFSDGENVDLPAVASFISDERRAVTAAAEAAEVLDHADRLLWTSRENVLYASEAKIVASLQSQLRDLIRDLRSAGCTRADADAATAIGNNRVAKHQKLQHAVEPFADIRNAARLVHREYQAEFGENYWLATTICQPLRIFPGLPVALAGVRARNIESGLTIDTASIPWPTVDPDAGETIELLGWLAEQPAGVAWIPTVAQLTKSIAEFTADRRRLREAAQDHLLMRWVPSEEQFLHGTSRAVTLEHAHQRQDLKLVSLGPKDEPDADTWELMAPAEQIVFEG